MQGVWILVLTAKVSRDKLNVIMIYYLHCGFFPFACLTRAINTVNPRCRSASELIIYATRKITNIEVRVRVTMKDQKKLHFTSSDKGDLRGLCNELNTLEKQCKELVWKNMVSRLIKTWFLSTMSV